MTDKAIMKTKNNFTVLKSDWSLFSTLLSKLFTDSTFRADLETADASLTNQTLKYGYKLIYQINQISHN